MALDKQHLEFAKSFFSAKIWTSINKATTPEYRDPKKIGGVYVKVASPPVPAKKDKTPKPTNNKVARTPVSISSFFLCGNAGVMGVLERG